MIVQASLAVVWMYWYVRADESSCCVDVHPHNSQTRLHKHTNALYSSWEDALDDGNM